MKPSLPLSCQGGRSMAEVGLQSRAGARDLRNASGILRPCQLARKSGKAALGPLGLNVIFACLCCGAQLRQRVRCIVRKQMYVQRTPMAVLHTGID